MRHKWPVIEKQMVDIEKQMVDGVFTHIRDHQGHRHYPDNCGITFHHHQITILNFIKMSPKHTILWWGRHSTYKYTETEYVVARRTHRENSEGSAVSFLTCDTHGWLVTHKGAILEILRHKGKKSLWDIGNDRGTGGIIYSRVVAHQWFILNFASMARSEKAVYQSMMLMMKMRMLQNLAKCSRSNCQCWKQLSKARNLHTSRQYFWSPAYMLTIIIISSNYDSTDNK